jgi:hypothetical protein
VDDYLEYEVEGIYKSRDLKKKGKEYLIKWQRCHKNKAAWMLAKDIKNAKEIVDFFLNDRNNLQC